jgi:predicted aldo/keto reductase-like oxidoreductase
MPKVLLYITTKITWIFLFFGTDINENRAHVYVGKKPMEEYCKIWLEPEISVAKSGMLTTSEINEVLKITKEYHSQLIKQWKKFINGEKIKILTNKK